MTHDIKPFYIDALKHNLDFRQANTYLQSFYDLGAEHLELYAREEELLKLPYFGVDSTGNFLAEEAGLLDEPEISPEDLDTWLKYGKTLKECQETEQGLVIGEDKTIKPEGEIYGVGGFIGKPSLGLQPRSVWLELRKYEIVQALHRQVEANEKLNEEWVLELAGMFEKESKDD